MWKYYVATVLIFSGCSTVDVNGTMCDKISMDKDEVMPRECRIYSEKKASKAFNKTRPKVKSADDVIEYSKEN